MWKCPECGAPNPDQGRFCTNCGTARGNGEVQRESDGGKGFRILLWAVLGVLIFTCAVLATLLILRTRARAPETEPPAVQTPSPAPEPPAAEPPTPEPPTPEPPAPVPVTPAPSPILIQTPTPEPPFTGYLDDASRVDDKGLAQLCRVMEDTIAENVRTSWGAPEHLLRSDYAGFYLLTGKSESAQPRNILVLVYRNDVNISIPAEKVNKNLSYFYCLRFENVWRNEDGSLRLSAPAKPAEQVNANIPGHYFYYKGYATLEELYGYQVGPYLRNYDFSESRELR